MPSVWVLLRQHRRPVSRPRCDRGLQGPMPTVRSRVRPEGL